MVSWPTLLPSNRRVPRWSTLSPLNRKMLRELWRMKGQLVSIGLVVAAAVMTLVTMRGTYEALAIGRADYYRDYRLGHVWAFLERAPESLRPLIQQTEGVGAVQTRVTSYATLDLPWLDIPGQGLFVSVPTDRRADVDDIHVREGRYLRPGQDGEVLVNENFFLENDLALGDTVRAVLNGVRREMIVVGSAISPAHSYAIPPGALYPDDERYGVFWVGEEFLGPNLDMEDAFNEVAVTLAPGADEVAVVDELDRLLEPYGGLGAYGREDQLSWKILNDELEQNRTTGTLFPMVFLGVAAFLLNLVLGRLVATQRTEIGALKAMGYHDREVGLHYLGYSVVAVGVGTAVGALGGGAAGDAMVELYQEYFKFPSLEYSLSWSLVALGGGVSLVAAALGGAGAVRRAVSLPPAEAMRPEPPPVFKAGWLERMGIANRAGTGGRLILRNLERRPLRALLSCLGIALSVAILVVGLFMFDGIGWMMELQFRIIQREDLSVSFNQELGPRVRHQLMAMDGIVRVEPYLSIPVRLRRGHRERELGITGLDVDGQLRQIVDASGRVHPLPLEGMVLSALLARRLHVSAGDTVDVQVLTGLRRTQPVVVADIVDDLLGVQAYMSTQSLRRITLQGPRATGAYLLTDGSEGASIGQRLQRAPLVASVVSPETMLASFQEQLDDSLFIAVFFIVGFAGVISVAVIYNGTRIALSERGRELASLRVLGFTRGEVSTLLFGEQAVVTVLAIPLGWMIGYGLAFLLVEGLGSETYRIPMVVSKQTYLWTALITLISAAASAGLVRRRLNRMDLIAVLKTRE